MNTAARSGILSFALAALFAPGAFAQGPWTVLEPTDTYYNDAVRSDSLIVAVGTAMSPVPPGGVSLISGGISTSPDGVTWTKRTSGTKRGFQAVAWTGSRFAAVGGYGTVRTSEDGISWTPRVSVDTLCHLTAIAWTGTQLVAAGEIVRKDSLDIVNCVMTSPDGATWTARYVPEKLSIRGLVWTGSLLVGVGYTGKGEAHGIVVTTPDGITWTERSPGPVPPLYKAIWTGASVEAVGYGRDSSVVLTSPDGVTWSRRNVRAGPSATSIAWSGRQFVVPLARTSSQGGSMLVSDSAGTAWSERATGSTLHAAQAILWVDSMFIAFGSRGLIAISPEDTSQLPIVAPVLVSPAAAATGLALSVTLKWRKLPGAAWYHAQLSTDSTFATGVVDSTADTTRVAAGLTAETRYFWRVRAGNAEGPGPWSAARHFTTTLLAPAAPALLSPSPYAFGQPVALPLVWSTVTGATQYEVQLALAPVFSPTLIDSVGTDTSIYVSGLSHGTSYYWRARARNAVDWSPWSTARLFNTVAAGPTAMNGAASFGRAPFTARGEVRFSLERETRVRMTRLDPNGRARVLFEATLDRGSHAVPLPSGSKGAALIRFEAGARAFLLPPQ